MTTLAITPNWKNKGAKFRGTVAAGEHVSVTIQNDNGEGGAFIADASTLRLRVVGMDGRTLAIFPEPVPEGSTPEEWDSDLSPLRCTLNLNTVQMLKAVPPATNVPLLWVLDDYDNNTLYFKEQFEVTHWPRLRGEEEPTDLDNYKDIIADFNTRLDGYDTRITGAENAAQAATENASVAAAKANQAVSTANQAVDKAETAQNSAAASAEAAAVAQVAAEAAQAAAEEAAESINSPDATLTEEGVAADAKAAGDAIADEKERAETAEVAEETRAKGVESGLRTDLTAAEKAIDDEAILRAAADADLEANKADKATTYTKTETDAKIAGVQTFKKYLVQTLPDPDEADMKGLYLVPTGETSEEGDLCDEYTVVGDVGEKRWEKIGGGTAVDLSGYYTKTEVDAKVEGKVDKIPGKGLSTEDYTTAEKTKLGGIAAGAQVNVIETVKVNGTALTPQDKAVNIPVPTLDNTVTPNSGNGVKSSGIWSAIWGALTALPTGFSSLYDWVVGQLAGKASKSDVDPLLFAQYYPDGSVKSAAEFTSGIKYDDPDEFNRTITVKPFCSTGTAADDNSGLVGRVVIPPFVDAQGTPYISDDGTRFKVVGVSGSDSERPPYDSYTLTAVIAPNTVTIIGGGAFYGCSALASISLPAVTDVGSNAFDNCDVLTSVSLPAAENIGSFAFNSCISMASASLPAATNIVASAFRNCSSLTTVDFGNTPRSDVPTLGSGAFSGVPAACKIIVPYTQYNDWIAADGWKDLPQEFVRHAEKADKPATFTTGNLAKFDSNGNLTDSGKAPYDFALIGDIAPDWMTTTAIGTVFAANQLCSFSGRIYRCILGYTFNGEDVPSYDPTHWTLATVEDVLAALRTGKQDALSAQQLANIAAVPNKANTSDLRYAISESIPLTVTGGAAATTLDDRTHNVRTVAAPGSGNTTTITATLPPIVAGKSRDMFLNLTVGTQAGDAGDISLSIVEPSGATVQIDIGSVEDIGIGKNEILFTENALPTTSGNDTTTHWLVTVRHEDFT